MSKQTYRVDWQDKGETTGPGFIRPVGWGRRTMLKHTPGPWQVLPQREPSMIEIQEQNDAGYTVASAWGGGAVEAQLDANARLIAAAPEMLVFIKRIACGSEAVGERGEHLCAYNGMREASQESWCTCARALLAKIEGGE